jgi:hypothetical protein
MFHATAVTRSIRAVAVAVAVAVSEGFAKGASVGMAAIVGTAPGRGNE